MMDYRKQPIHRDVKALRKLQKEVLFETLPLDKLTMGKGTETEIMNVLSQDSTAMAAFTDAMEELDYVGTIMLSTGLSPEAIEQLPEDEFQAHYEASKAALGGTAGNFLMAYAPAIMSPATPNRPLQAKPSNPEKAKSGSGTSSEPSGARKGARS